MNEQPPSSVWFVTGCSSGLGRALATHLLAGGYRLVATTRQLTQLDDLVARYPERCHALALDVTERSQVKAAVAQAAEAFGRIDVVVNNAGYGLAGALEELSDEEISRNFEANFFGALEIIRVALPILRAQRQGHIVNISAAAAIANYPGFSIYGAAKWALEGVSESLAAELKPLGIKVMIVEPGPFRTEFAGHSLERGQIRIADYDRSSGKFLRFLEGMNGRQPGDPDKAADAIINAVESDPSPLRLVLGKYATDKVRKKLASTEKELAAWEHLGLAVDFAASQ
jgi:NAD(P)-dependent dehydrogenase (short-subunit alcohol dehydrogenase family)